MPQIQRGRFDTTLDNIVSRLDAEASVQRGINAALGWTTLRNRTRPWEAPELANEAVVNCWLPNLDPVQEGSSVRRVNSLQATYYIDCFAAGTETPGVKGADADALDRLYLLAQQTMYALFDLADHHWGLPKGTLASQEWPRWETLQNEAWMPEDKVIAGRWTARITYAWTPADITLVDLDQISVTDTERFGALYDYT